MRAPVRRGGVALCAAVGLLLAAACGDDGGGGDPGTIEWWHIQPEDGELAPVWNQFGEEFSDPEGVQVNITPYENDAFKSALATAMQAGDPPDLYQSWGGGVLREQVTAGQVRDLTDEIPDVIEQISPGALEPYTIDGRVYGLPWNMGMVGFWYNTELFEEAGITEAPQTWSQLLDTVQQLKDAGITPIALGEADQWPGHFWWGYLAMRVAGLSALEAAYDASSLDDPGFVAAGERLQELVELEPFQEGYLAVGYEEGDGQAAIMGNGEAAMELMGHWGPQAQLDWAGLEGDEADQALARTEFFPFPEVEGGNGATTEIFGGGDGFAVGANAPDEILDYVRLIFDNYQQIVDAGGVVTVLEDATVDDPNLQAVLDTLAEGTGFQLYLDQDWPPAVGDEVKAATAGLFAGEAAPEDVVTRINEVWARES